MVNNPTMLGLSSSAVIHYLILLVSICKQPNSVFGFTKADFPPHFIFGAGSSAYQMEGAALKDGRTPSILDTYNPGDANRTCDQYYKYKEDVKLMVDTGLPAYKLSISWSRLIPNGRGPVNRKALQYYNNLINELVNNGIQPHVVLLHLDTPQALEDDYGGWINQQIVKDFTIYADVCFREFGDRVLYWTTFNEPNIAIMEGYDDGTFAPKRCSPPFGSCTRGNSTTEPYIAAHNTLLAHASVVRLYRQIYQEKQKGYIGLNLYVSWIKPKTNMKHDLFAAQTSTKFLMGWFLDPLVFGDYPAVMKSRAGSRLPSFTKYESQLVKNSFDFIAVNCYTSLVVENNPSILLLHPRDAQADSGANATYGDANDNDKVLENILGFLKEEYNNPPTFVHENGYTTACNASLIDESRANFLNASIGSVLNALRNGSNVKGYFVWSFLDSRELRDEDSKRCFGLYYVDFQDPDRKRYPKFSAYWYSAFLNGRSFPVDQVILEVTNSTHGLQYDQI